MKKQFIVLLGLLGSAYFSNNLYGQGAPSSVNPIGQDSTERTIITAVPFLSISPDARSAGMGDVGAAITPDANATFWNPARLAFSDKKSGVALSYTPWLRQLVNDMSISYLSGYYKFKPGQVISGSLTYFDLGDIQFTDVSGFSIGNYNPREFMLRAQYSRTLTENLSLAVGGFWVHSNISNVFINTNGSQGQARPGNSGGVDLGAYYQKNDVNLFDMQSDIAFGASITNLGAKISYSGAEERDFLPINFRLGGRASLNLDAYNKITLAIDANKLLVPTPRPGENVRDITLLSGIFGSFGDAPDGLKEEAQEIIGNFGVEYSYNDLFFVRTGYATENKQKGGRKFYTIGLGARYQIFGLDAAYLIPTKRGNPLAETIRFTLSLAFNDGDNPDTDN